MEAGDLGPTWTHEDFLSSPCSRCDAKPGEPCNRSAGPLTTGDGDAHWHEERRPSKGRQEEAVKCPACQAAPGVGCDGPRSHPSRLEAYQAHLQETIELHTPQLSRWVLKPGMHEMVIRGCSCGFIIEGPEHVTAFAEHVHWPIGAVHALINITGLLYDVLDYYPDVVNRPQVLKALAVYLGVRP